MRYSVLGVYCTPDNSDCQPPANEEIHCSQKKKPMPNAIPTIIPIMAKLISSCRHHRPQASPQVGLTVTFSMFHPQDNLLLLYVKIALLYICEAICQYPITQIR